MSGDGPGATRGDGHEQGRGYSPVDDPDDGDGRRSPRPDWIVVGAAGVSTTLFVGWGVVDPTSLASVTAALLDGVIRGGGWAFSLAVLGFVVFALWLAFSRHGRIRLGGDDERPTFRTSSWVAMMFIAGMGIGLMFYGVAEPLAFYTEPPPGAVAPGDQDGALRAAMATSLFHWPPTRGRPTRWSAWPSPTPPSARAAASSSAPRSCR